MSHALLKRIDDFIPTLGGWCTPERAQHMAMLVLTLQPETTVVLGVWAGRDTFAPALAHQFLGKGSVLAVDPWSAPASIEGQGEADTNWWKNQQMHDKVYAEFMQKREMLGLAAYVDVCRVRSDQAEVPKEIGLMICDGNHGPQAIADVQRWAPSVIVGGVVYMDDVGWSGGAVMEACRILVAMGFRELYRLPGDKETGKFFQRVK